MNDPTIPVEVLEQVQPSGTLIGVREAHEHAAGGTTAWQRPGRPVEVGF